MHALIRVLREQRSTTFTYSLGRLLVSDDHLYLSAEEAAGILGVNLPTLYAYVSRKNIRSVKVEGSRKRRYWAADIERLTKGKGKTQATTFLRSLKAATAD